MSTTVTTEALRYSPAPPLRSGGLPLNDLKAEIAGREHEVLAALGITPRARGHINCPFPDHSDRNPSFRWDNRRARWYCTCGIGDVIDAVQRAHGTDFAGAARFIRDVLGLPQPGRAQTPKERRARERRLTEVRERAAARAAEREAREAADDARAIADARRLWGASQPADGTPVPVYLAARGITLPAIPPTLRYLPPNSVLARMLPETLRDLAHRRAFPAAMVASFGLSPSQHVPAVHLTLLRPDGTGKADVQPQKVIFGRPRGHPLVLGPPCDGLALVVGEGIETVLSDHVGSGLEPWAAGAASLMPALADAVPNVVEAVTILQEKDEAGRRCAGELAARLHSRDIEPWLTEDQ